MILVALLIGAILIVSAFRGTYSELFSDLGHDVPGFTTWAAAIVALGALGYIPGIKGVSRGLMSLVLVVLILNNYKALLAGFQAVATPPKTAAPATGPGSITILQATPNSAFSTGTSGGPNG